MKHNLLGSLLGLLHKIVFLLYIYYQAVLYFMHCSF